MLKIVMLLLVFLGIIAMFGSVRRIILGPPKRKRRGPKAKKCRKCGAYVVGDDHCRCEID